MTGIQRHFVLTFDGNNNLIFEPGDNSITAIPNEKFTQFESYNASDLVGGDNSVLDIPIQKDMLITISINDNLHNWQFWNNTASEFKDTIFAGMPLAIDGANGSFDNLYAEERIMTIHHKGDNKNGYKFNIYIENMIFQNGTVRRTKLIVDPVLNNGGGGDL